MSEPSSLSDYGDTREDYRDLSISEMYGIATPYEKVEMTFVVGCVLFMGIVAWVLPDEELEQLEKTVTNLRLEIDYVLSWYRAAYKEIFT